MTHVVLAIGLALTSTALALAGSWWALLPAVLALDECAAALLTFSREHECQEPDDEHPLPPRGRGPSSRWP